MWLKKIRNPFNVVYQVKGVYGKGFEVQFNDIHKLTEFDELEGYAFDSLLYIPISDDVVVCLRGYTLENFCDDSREGSSMVYNTYVLACDGDVLIAGKPHRLIDMRRADFNIAKNIIKTNLKKALGKFSWHFPGVEKYIDSTVADFLVKAYFDQRGYFDKNSETSGSVRPGWGNVKYHLGK